MIALGAGLVLRARLEQHDMVGELDRERVVGAADAPDARRELLGGGRRRGAGGGGAGGGGGRRRRDGRSAMSAGLACTPSSCASNVGQPARLCTIVLGNLRPLRSR